MRARQMSPRVPSTTSILKVGSDSSNAPNSACPPSLAYSRLVLLAHEPSARPSREPEALHAVSSQASFDLCPSCNRSFIQSDSRARFPAPTLVLTREFGMSHIEVTERSHIPQLFQRRVLRAVRSNRWQVDLPNITIFKLQDA
jgi:hypothetical protein